MKENNVETLPGLYGWRLVETEWSGYVTITMSH